MPVIRVIWTNFSAGPPQQPAGEPHAAVSEDDADDDVNADDDGEGQEGDDVSELAEGVQSLKVTQPKVYKKVFGLQLSGLPDGTTEGEIAHHAHLVPPKAVKVGRHAVISMNLNRQQIIQSTEGAKQVTKAVLLYTSNASLNKAFTSLNQVQWYKAYPVIMPTMVSIGRYY